MLLMKCYQSFYFIQDLICIIEYKNLSQISCFILLLNYSSIYNTSLSNPVLNSNTYDYTILIIILNRIEVTVYLWLILAANIEYMTAYKQDINDIFTTYKYRQNRILNIDIKFLIILCKFLKKIIELCKL